MHALNAFFPNLINSQRDGQRAIPLEWTVSAQNFPVSVVASFYFVILIVDSHNFDFPLAQFCSAAIFNATCESIAGFGIIVSWRIWPYTCWVPFFSLQQNYVALVWWFETGRCCKNHTIGCFLSAADLNKPHWWRRLKNAWLNLEI